MKTYLLLMASFLLFACQNNERNAATEKAAEIAFEKFGKEITAENVKSVKEIIPLLENQDSVFIKVNSQVNEVCKKKGCWMTVALDKTNEMRVKFKDYDFFVPLNCEGKNVIIEGWAYKHEMSAATLQHYAADEGLSEEEIAKITEPKIEYTFMADGVLMN